MIAGVSLTPLILLGLFPSYWVALSSLHMSCFALSYCVLFCPACLSSLGGRLFSEEEMEEESGERGDEESREEQREEKLWSGCVV